MYYSHQILLSSLEVEFMAGHYFSFMPWELLHGSLGRNAFKVTLFCPLFHQQLLLVVAVKTNSDV